MRMIDAEEIRHVVPLPETFPIVADAMIRVSLGGADQPGRRLSAQPFAVVRLKSGKKRGGR